MRPQAAGRNHPRGRGPRAGGLQAAEPRALRERPTTGPGGTQTPVPSAGSVRVLSPPQLSSKPEHGRHPANLACRGGSSAQRWRCGGPTGAHGWGPASIQPPCFVWEDPCCWLWGPGSGRAGSPRKVGLAAGWSPGPGAGTCRGVRVAFQSPRLAWPPRPSGRRTGTPLSPSAHWRQVLSHLPSSCRSTGVAGSSIPMGQMSGETGSGWGARCPQEA